MGEVTAPPVESPSEAAAVVERFNDAFNRADLTLLAELLTDDVVFESTAPPAGIRNVGRPAVLAAFAEFFASTTDPDFQTEEMIAAHDRVVVRWRFTWGGEHPGFVRGVDIFTVTGGRVAEKAAYVKG